MHHVHPFDPLWVPLLTHYDDASTPGLDRAHTADHLRHLTPHVRQYLIAGTTGDGWEMTDSVLAAWLDLLGDPTVVGSGHTVLIGALAETTEAVIARARMIEARIEAKPLTAVFAGLTVCAPVDVGADQERITAHFQAILEATSSPIAVYQLPQVTQNEIAPETFEALARRNPRITLFKDTSGADGVALSGVETGRARLLRGAEGDYDRHLKPNGPYDGWLLSTANGYAPQLRAIAGFVAQGREAEAAAESDRLTRLVAAQFDLAADLPHGNPFSNCNRAVDHLLAYGDDWRQVPPPRLVSGHALPEDFLGDVQDLLTRAELAAPVGYRGRLAA